MQKENNNDVNNQEGDRIIKKPTFDDWQDNLTKRSELCEVSEYDKESIFFVFNKLDHFESTHNRDVCVNGIFFIHKRWNFYVENGTEIENEEEVKKCFDRFGFKELKRCDDDVYDYDTGTKHVFMSNKAKNYYAWNKKSCVDTLSFIPNGLTDPIMLDAGDSFIIGDNNQILWCHCPFEMHEKDNVFNGIKVQHILEGTEQNQMLFNYDGTPQRFWIKDNIEQKICGITISKITNSRPSHRLVGDIEVYNINNFDFYAKEGQKCCGVKIDNKTPIEYKCVQPGHIQLTFKNKNGQEITVDVNEKGESLEEIKQKKKDDAIRELKDKINIEFVDKEKNPNVDFDKSLTFVAGTINNDEIDGLSIDKNEPAKFIMGKKGDITQIYRLDKQKFPLEHDNNEKHEIIYTKQANKKDFVNYYDKNEKQQILDWGEHKKQRLNEYKKKSNFVIRTAIEQGECQTDNGKMIFNKDTGEMKFIKNKSTQKHNDKNTTCNIYK